MSRIFDDLPSSLNTAREQPHKLAYEWTFWQHFRPTSIPTDTTTVDHQQQQETTAADETSNTALETDDIISQDTSNAETSTVASAAETADMRAVQYLNGTTLLTFPKYNSTLESDQTDTIDTIEQFWESFVNLKSLNDVPIDTEYFFFKKGIKPMWEDEYNKKGGRWYFSFNNNNQTHRRNFMCVFWELLLYKLVSGQFLPSDFQLPLNDEILDNPEFSNLESKMHMTNKELNKLIMDDIAGLVVSLRSKKIILSIWNTHLSYDQFKQDHDITGTVKNEEYNHMFRERLNTKTKQIFEEIGLTTYQFRQLIYDSVSQTLNEALDLVKTKETATDLNRTYKQKIFKYTPHFVDTPYIPDNNNKKGIKDAKFKSKKNTNNGDWNAYKNLTSINGTKLNSAETEKFSNLGKLRKKVEFNDEGLMVEELNVLSFKQKWNRKRRPVIRNRNSDHNANIEYGYDNYDDDE